MIKQFTRVEFDAIRKQVHAVERELNLTSSTKRSLAVDNVFSAISQFLPFYLRNPLGRWLLGFGVDLIVDEWNRLFGHEWGNLIGLDIPEGV